MAHGLERLENKLVNGKKLVIRLDETVTGSVY